MIIRFGLGLLVVLILFLLLVTSDFYFTRRVKARITAINAEAEAKYNFRPLVVSRFAVLSLFLWVPSYYLFTCGLLLEYRLLLAIVFWAAATAILYFYGQQKTSAYIAWQSLPFWLLFALAAGTFILPGMAGIYALL